MSTESVIVGTEFRDRATLLADKTYEKWRESLQTTLPEKSPLASRKAAGSQTGNEFSQNLSTEKVVEKFRSLSPEKLLQALDEIKPKDLDWKGRLLQRNALYQACSLIGDMEPLRRKYSPPVIQFDENNNVLSIKLDKPPAKGFATHGFAGKVKKSAKNGEILKKIKDINLEGAENEQKCANEVEEEVEKLKKEKPKENRMRERLEKKKEEVKQKSNENIDKVFEKSLDAIEELPDEEQDEAADTFLESVDGMMAFIEEIWGYLGGVVQALVEWFNGIVKALKEAFENVVRTVKRAVSFIRSIFG